MVVRAGILWQVARHHTDSDDTALVNSALYATIDYNDSSQTIN